MNKQLLILPDTKKFTKAQAKELSEAGFVVVYLDDPAKARLVSGEIPPVSTDAMLFAAMKAIRATDDYRGYRTFLDHLITASTTAQPPTTGADHG